MKAYSYRRFSSKKQEHGDSIRRQEELARKFCDDKNLEYVEKSFEDLGVSGWKNTKRDGLETLLEAIDTGVIHLGDYVLIEHPDRLSRRGFDALYTIIQQIVSKGILLHFLSENLTLCKDYTNNLVDLIRICVAADQSRKDSDLKSERIQAAKTAKRLRAVDGEKQSRRLPFWISFDDDNNEYYFNDRIVAVRKMIELRRTGMGEGTISTAMNELLDQEFMRPTKAKYYSSTVIRKVLRHPAIVGSYQTTKLIRNEEHPDGKRVDDKLIEDYYPALMTHKEHELLMPYAPKKGGVISENHFSGLLRCRECGSVMVRKTTKTKYGCYNYFVCWSSSKKTIAQNTGKVCDQKSIKDLHELIFRMCKRLKIELPSAVNNNHEIEKEIRTNENTLAELQQAILAGVNVTSLIQTSVLVEQKIQDLQKQLTPSVNETDYDLLSSHQDNPIKWNDTAQRLIESITVKVVTVNRTKKTVNVRIDQRNGHIITATRLSDGKTFWGNTEAREELTKHTPLPWE